MDPSLAKKESMQLAVSNKAIPMLQHPKILVTTVILGSRLICLPPTRPMVA
jgi:hypothetical protein